MLELMNELPPEICGLKAVGTVTKEDYESVLKPIAAQARREGRRLRLLYEVGPEFEGLTPGAAWEDAKLGLHSMPLFDGCAIVTDVGWVRDGTRFVGSLMPCPVQVFGNPEREDAVRWLSELPDGLAASNRLIPDRGVIVVEIEDALRVQDFDSLALTADSWIETHGDLQGIVFHAGKFPGWENFGSFLRHAQFVRNHHRKVKRIALSADSMLADLVPRIGEHFVKAEVKGFGHDELEKAIDWAGEREIVTPSPRPEPVLPTHA